MHPSDRSYACWQKGFHLFVLTVVAAATIGCTSRKRDRYLIPDGYAGWLCISYGVGGAPELPWDGGFRLVVFPPSGVVVTSSAGLPGEGYTDQYHYYAETTRRTLDVSKELGGGYTEASTDRPEQFTLKFWVSRDAKADYPAYVKEHTQQCGPF